MTLKFSKSAAIYGVAGATAQEVFLAISKHYKSVALVIDEDSTPYCDIVIVDRVKKLLAIRHTINTNMIVVVCDSIVNLETLMDVQALDYTGKFSVSYDIVKPKWKLEKRQFPVDIRLKTKSPLDIALGKLSHSRFLAEYNLITSHMNKPARDKFRQHLVNHLNNRKNKEVIEFVRRILKGPFKEPFIEMLQSSYFDMLCAAVWEVKRNQMKADEAQAIYKLDDSYEIVYLVKMIEELK